MSAAEERGDTAEGLAADCWVCTFCGLETPYASPIGPRPVPGACAERSDGHPHRWGRGSDVGGDRELRGELGEARLRRNASVDTSLFAALGPSCGPGDRSEAVRRVDVAMCAGMSQVEAIESEIARLSAPPCVVKEADEYSRKVKEPDEYSRKVKEPDGSPLGELVRFYCRFCALDLPRETDVTVGRLAAVLCPSRSGAPHKWILEGATSGPFVGGESEWDEMDQGVDLLRERCAYGGRDPERVLALLREGCTWQEALNGVPVAPTPVEEVKQPDEPPAPAPAKKRGRPRKDAAQAAVPLSPQAGLDVAIREVEAVRAAAPVPLPVEPTSAAVEVSPVIEVPPVPPGERASRVEDDNDRMARRALVLADEIARSLRELGDLLSDASAYNAPVLLVRRAEAHAVRLRGDVRTWARLALSREVPF